MKIAIAVALILGLTFASEPHSVRQELVDKIKVHGKWIPKEVHENPFKDMPMEELKKRAGGHLGIKPDDPFSLVFKKLNLGIFSRYFKSHPKQTPAHNLQATLAAFNWVDDGGSLSSCIMSVRDQGSCGSCWAFSSTGLLEDRMCIKTNGATTTRLSPQDMVTCDLGNQGCNGGWLSNSASFLMSHGVVSEDCLPYESGEDGTLGFCMYRCKNKGNSYKKYGCKWDSMKVLTEIVDIQNEIKNHGPVMTGFTIYEDFMSYASGEYSVTDGSAVLGGHAVIIYGWDYDGSSNLYWKAQNQWGTTWGNSGFFDIIHGEAGFGLVTVSCDPDLE